MAINTAVGNIKSALTNAKNGNIKGFSIGFKTKRDYRQGFSISEKGINISKSKVVIFKSKGLKINIRKKDIKKLEKVWENKSCKVQKVGKKHWYLLVPYTRTAKEIRDRGKVISLDPGVRKFQSGYDPENQRFLKFGEGTSQLIKKLSEKIDRLKSLREKGKGYGMSKIIRIQKLRTKMEGIVKNLHYQLGNYLTKNYNVIVVSDLDTKTLLEGCNLRKSTKRQLQMLSLCKFRERLKYLANVMGSRVIEINESYTSKTCTSCGYLNDKSSSEYLKCKNCLLMLDRDLIGSRNILLKTILWYRMQCH